MPILIVLVLLLAATLIAAIFSVNAMWHTLRTGLPFVTTPNWAIGWFKQNLQLTSTDQFYELGCGDARVTTAIAKKFPNTKFTGIEIQWWPYILARWRTRNLKNVSIRRGDIFQQDLTSATVVFGFYITSFVPRLSEKLRQELQPGARVFSYGFQLPNWIPVETIPNPQKRGSSLLLYRR